MRSGDTVLQGRDAERHEIDQIIAGLRSNSGASLVLTGDTGIGKTALVRYAADHAEPVRVLAARGVPAEAALPFAGLHGLLGPVLDFLPRIPARQAAALSAAFALSPATAVDLFAVAAGTLSLLATAGRDGPLLVLIDDFHMLDPTSREALLFVARRTASENVGIVLATSADEEQTGLPCHHIPPLDAVASRWLLREASPGPVAPAVADHMVKAAAGVPLALIEAPQVLTPGQLAGAEPLPDPPPVGPMVRRAFTPQFDALRAPERTALLVAAAAGEVGLASTLGALDALGVPPEALEAAEAKGLITLVGDSVTFRHPLLRAVAYHEAAPAQRRAVHRALADVTPSARRAWHLGTAALGPDEHAADELERTALGCGCDLPVGSAARLMERAAELTGSAGLRARRCVSAAELWQLAGAVGRVRELVDQATRGTDDLSVRAYGQAVLARTESRCGRPVQAHRLLVREAARVRGSDPTGAATMLLDAAEACCLAGEARAALVAVRRACLLAGRAPAPLPAVLAAQHAGVLARCGQLPAARELLAGCRAELEGAVLDAEVPTGWRQIVRVGLPALLARLGELHVAGRILDEVIAQARALEASGLLPGLLAERAELSRRTGDWVGAQALAGEAAWLAERVEQASDLAAALLCLARLAAARGLRTECGVHLERAREIARRCRLGALAVPMDAAEGLLELGDGNFEAAFVRLECVARQVEAGSAPDYGWVSWVPDFVEAAVRVSRTDEARRVLNAMRANASGSLLLPAAVAQCQALLAADSVVAADSVEERFDEALRPCPGGDAPFERARAELCFGEWLRGRGRPAAAGLRIRGALATFEEMGARPWAQRARRELTIVESAPRPAAPVVTPAPVAAPSPVVASPRPMSCLTTQEQKVTMLVGQGATNREAASTLFLSTKTIEFHLRSVYRKLGVRSRAELAHLVGQGDGTQVSA
jgi:DNA-binding CsgD family transcriptional regulator